MIRKINRQELELLTCKEFDFSDAWNLNMLTSSFDAGRFFAYGYFERDLLVGFVTYSISVDDADIEDIAVLPSHRRRKIASELLKFAEQQLLQLGKKRILLEVRQNNFPAINLYTLHGYKNISVRKKYYADGVDAIVMAKEL